MKATWKAAERAVALRIGGRRVSHRGAGTRAADCESGWLSVEVKHRQALPAWLRGALAQAERNAPAGKLPVVVLHEAGERYDAALVVLRLGDFMDWFGDGTRGEEDGG